VIAEAHLDPASVYAAVQRFAGQRAERPAHQREMIGALSALDRG
jgi:hypothetical protein